MKLHLLLAIASFFLHESCGYPNPVESINGVGEWGGNGENNGKYHDKFIEKGK